jgi:hypothetical protein
MIFVIGTGRCGSTTTARLLETRLGVDMGGRSTVSAAQPEGDWETEYVRRLNWKLIDQQIGPEEWTGDIQEWAKDQTEPWGVKHPGFSYIMPELLNAFPDADIIWAIRDLEKVADSWKRVKDELNDNELTIQLQYRHWSIAFWVLYTRRSHLMIDYTERQDEDRLVKLMGEYLGLEEI